MILGGKVTVDTPTGSVAVPVPEASEAGKRLRLKGKGLPRYKASGSGDLYLTLRPLLPTSLSDEQRRLFRQLQSLPA